MELRDIKGIRVFDEEPYDIIVEPKKLELFGEIGKCGTLLVNETGQRFLKGNRSYQKRVMKELVRMERKLLRVEFIFYKDLFESHESFDYEFIYNFHNEQYQRICKIMDGWFKPKYCRPNKRYFADNFKPKKRP